MSRLTNLRDMTAAAFPWERWEQLIADNGVSVDRPRGSVHPVHPSIIYPIDYGFIQQTTASDGHEVDVFVGTADSGLVALIITEDFRKSDREFKLLHDCSPEEIYLVNGFINFDRRLMEGELVLRRPMHELWI
ncbi:MAG: hypothetical protein HKN13_02025 [Rhodothermales bacterium]|nr:hypothetical protein [Rhodothermales bacterium]